jgi:MYXO-CTERM domain-containing protein
MIFAFTPEVGSSADYFWPAPSRILPLCEENLPVNLLMAQIADNPRKLGSPVTAAMLTTSPVYADQYTVLSSSIADTSYAVSGKSAGSYYYKVPAEDAENQWSVWSERGEVEVRDTPVPASSATTIALAAAALMLAALALRRRRSRV